MHATERHAVLLDHGWRTRIDGLLLPPDSWPDPRPHTPQAAWHAHTQAEHVGTPPDDAA